METHNEKRYCKDCTWYKLSAIHFNSDPPPHCLMTANPYRTLNEPGIMEIPPDDPNTCKYYTNSINTRNNLHQRIFNTRLRDTTDLYNKHLEEGRRRAKKSIGEKK
jgi:hypothetical protein